MFTSESTKMKWLLTVLIFITGFTINAQTDEFTKELIYTGQRLKIDADLASSIILTESSDKVFKAKVLYNLNNGELNEAVEVDLSNENGRIRLEIDLNERMARSNQNSDCKDENASWWGDEWGGRVCADIQVEIQIPSGAKIEIETVIADVLLQGDYEEVDVKSVTGNIDLDWPERKGFQLEMKTVNGSIYTNYDFKPGGNESLPLISAHEFDTEWGNGKYFVRLETVTSDIYLRKR